MPKKKAKRARRLDPARIQDLVEGGQQVLSSAQETAKRVRETVQEAVTSFEKRRDVEVKNLRGRLRDLNTNMGGLERRYRSLEKRLTKQVEILSGRAVKASDLDRRLRSLEGEIRRATGLGGRAAASAGGVARTSSRGTRRAAGGARKVASRTGRAATTARQAARAAASEVQAGAPPRPAKRRAARRRATPRPKPTGTSGPEGPPATG